MEKNKSRGTIFCHSFPFLFGDLKIQMNGSAQARFSEIIKIEHFFGEDENTRGKSNRLN